MKSLETVVSHINNLLKKQSNRSDSWKNSQFQWIRGLTPKAKGVIGEKFVRLLLEDSGIRVSDRLSSDHDLVISGKRIEVKFATLAKKDVFIFNQIRNDSYDFLLLFGLTQKNTYLWLLPKSEVLNQSGKPKHPEIQNQHRGKAGSDTYFINSLNPQSPYPWLKRFGGELSVGIKIAKQIK